MSLIAFSKWEMRNLIEVYNVNVSIVLFCVYICMQRLDFPSWVVHLFSLVFFMHHECFFFFSITFSHTFFSACGVFTGDHDACEIYVIFPCGLLGEYIFALPPVHTLVTSGGFLSTWRDLCVYLNKHYIHVWSPRLTWFLFELLHDVFLGVNDTARFIFALFLQPGIYFLFFKTFLCFMFCYKLWFMFYPFIISLLFHVASHHLLNDWRGINNTLVLLSLCELDAAANAPPFFAASHFADFSTFFLFISLPLSSFSNHIFCIVCKSG